MFGLRQYLMRNLLLLYLNNPDKYLSLLEKKNEICHEAMTAYHSIQIKKEDSAQK